MADRGGMRPPLLVTVPGGGRRAGPRRLAEWLAGGRALALVAVALTLLTLWRGASLRERNGGAEVSAKWHSAPRGTECSSSPVTCTLALSQCLSSSFQLSLPRCAARESKGGNRSQKGRGYMPSKATEGLVDRVGVGRCIVR